jgi:hypothetical protein
MPLGVLFSLVVGLLLSLMAAIILLAAWLDRGKGQGQSDGAKWPWRRVNHPERERAPTRTRRQPAGASGVGGYCRGRGLCWVAPDHLDLM